MRHALLSIFLLSCSSHLIGMLPSETEEALLSAANRGNVEEVSRILHAHPDINLNAKDGDGRTALMYAAWLNRVEVCKLLVAYGADVNFGWRMNPLLMATEMPAKVKFDGWREGLYREPTQIDIQEITKKTFEICQLLIKHEADVNIYGHWSGWRASEEYKRKTGFSALMYAACHNDIPLCQLLIRAAFRLTHEQKKSIVILIGSLRRTKLPKTRDTNRLIAQQLKQAFVKKNVQEHKTHVLEQIHSNRWLFEDADRGFNNPSDKKQSTIDQLIQYVQELEQRASL